MLSLSAFALGSAQYEADLQPIKGVKTRADGRVYITINNGRIYGNAEGYHLETDLNVKKCTAANCMGAHVHAGTSCENATTQGGHYHGGDTDPWGKIGYASTDYFGDARAHLDVDIGIKTDDLAGRAFILHAFDGSRSACGILKRAGPTPTPSRHTFSAHMEPIKGAKTAAIGEVELTISDGRIQGSMKGYHLESDLDHIKCTAANCMGAHVHAGTSCENSTTQGGHYHGGDTDPWGTIGYTHTDHFGTGLARLDVDIGIKTDDLAGRAFVFHAFDGSRSACGILKARYAAAPKPLTLPVPVMGAAKRVVATSGDSCSLYEVSGDTCGQSDLDCAYVKYAKVAEKGLKDGTCAAQGYTVKGSSTTKHYPVVGDITVTEYTKP